jgi:hypothetical protein
MYGQLEVIDVKKGTRLTARGNCWHDKQLCEPTDFIAIRNKAFDPDLKPDAGWTPKLYGPASTAEAPEIARERVLAEGGPGRLRRN